MPDHMEQTLAIIKPESFHRTKEIVASILREGFTILQAKEFDVTKAQAAQFYGLEEVNDDALHLSTGLILVMCLSAPAAVDKWLNLIGPARYNDRMTNPGCWRNRFGTPKSDVENGLHGSETILDALRELHFFFPELVYEPGVAGKLDETYDHEQDVNSLLAVGLSALMKERPDDPMTWLADWLMANNPNKHDY